MPNWTDNILVIRGTKEDVRKFYDENHDVERQHSVASDFTKPGDMVFMLKRLIPIPSELHITSPAQTDEEKAQAQANIEKYGYPDWYHFCTNVWGTKWDVDSAQSDFNEDGTELTITFATAWSPIEGWLGKATETYNTLSFDYQSCDAAMDWHWEFHAENGEVTEEFEMTMKEAIEAGKWEGYGYDEWYDEECEDTEDSSQPKPESVE